MLRRLRAMLDVDTMCYDRRLLVGTNPDCSPKGALCLQLAHEICACFITITPVVALRLCIASQPCRWSSRNRSNRDFGHFSAGMD